MSDTITREKVRRYIVVNEATNRVVATCGGTHAIMERVCDGLGQQRQSSYFYDDASAASQYLAQQGPNVPLSMGAGCSHFWRWSDEVAADTMAAGYECDYCGAKR